MVASDFVVCQFGVRFVVVRNITMDVLQTKTSVMRWPQTESVILCCVVTVQRLIRCHLGDPTIIGTWRCCSAWL